MMNDCGQMGVFLETRQDKGICLSGLYSMVITGFYFQGKRRRKRSRSICIIYVMCVCRVFVCNGRGQEKRNILYYVVFWMVFFFFFTE